MVDVMKQRTTETWEKLEKTKMNKEENQLCPTGMQWGGHITHPRVNARICANTRARSLKGKLSIYSGS